ncbi:hypothetical protein EMIT0P201_50068 [Pseudomonas chlororaphis]
MTKTFDPFGRIWPLVLEQDRLQVLQGKARARFGGAVGVGVVKKFGAGSSREIRALSA